MNVRSDYMVTDKAKIERKRKRAFDIIYKLRFKEGCSRKWIATQVGVRDDYITFAVSERCLRHKKHVPLCPMYAIDKIIEWSERNNK